jgi:hypothetical protein
MTKDRRGGGNKITTKRVSEFANADSKRGNIYGKPLLQDAFYASSDPFVDEKLI